MSLTKAQLDERRTGIGGSDAATILGLNPYTTAYELYLDKRGEIEHGQDNEYLKESRYWGSVLEPAVVARYVHETGYKVQRSNKLIRSKEHPFMIANIDRKVVGEDRRIGFEAKTAVRADGWGPSGGDVIPPYYMCQVQHYLAVTNYDLWDLGVLIGNRDYRWYRIAPIQDMIEALIEGEEEFWDRVKHAVPPEPTWQSKATTRLLKEIYPGTNGDVVQLPEAADAYFRCLKDAEEQKKINEDIITGCKNRLAMLTGEASIGLVGELGKLGAMVRRQQTRKEYTVPESTFMVQTTVTKLPVAANKAIEGGTVKRIRDET